MKLHFAIHNFEAYTYIFLLSKFNDYLFIKVIYVNNLKIRKYCKAYNEMKLSPASSLCIPNFCSQRKSFSTILVVSILFEMICLYCCF